MSALVDSGLLIAVLNRNDQHHRWAVRRVLSSRERGERMGVPSVVVGEAYTKLRYDRRVSARNDARPALNVFGLVGSSSDLFETRLPDGACHERAARILGTYVDHCYSYVDAVVFATAEGDPAVDRIVTVDRRDFAAYRFDRQLLIDHP